MKKTILLLIFCILNFFTFATVKELDFQETDGRYRITFDNLSYDTGTSHFNKRQCGKNEYNEMVPQFEEIINIVNNSIKSNNSNDDW